MPIFPCLSSSSSGGGRGSSDFLPLTVLFPFGLLPSPGLGGHSPCGSESAPPLPPGAVFSSSRLLPLARQCTPVPHKATPDPPSPSWSCFLLMMSHRAACCQGPRDQVQESLCPVGASRLSSLHRAACFRGPQAELTTLYSLIIFFKRNIHS